jgi:membrane protein DedA with SNARE-associated domain
VTEFILSLQTLDPLWVYVALVGVAFVENLFPPSPSDVAIVFAGSLVGLGTITFLPALAAATAGGTIGFLLMYRIGMVFGNRILEQGKIGFLPPASVQKAEEWFRRYGYWLIAANRFLAGTRAVVSFFAGVAELDLRRTTLLSAVSSLAWNSILLVIGYTLGKNWEAIGLYLTTYSQVVTGIVIIVVLIWVARFMLQRKNGGARP